jgi:hypothetical protein
MTIGRLYVETVQMHVGRRVAAELNYAVCSRLRKELRQIDAEVLQDAEMHLFDSRNAVLTEARDGGVGPL